MIEAGKKYKATYAGETRDEIYLALWADKESALLENLSAGIRFVHPQKNDPFTWTEYVEPKKGVKYMNITYHGDVAGYQGSTWKSKAAADAGARPGRRVACIRVPWTEGQFDD